MDEHDARKHSTVIASREEPSGLQAELDARARKLYKQKTSKTGSVVVIERQSWSIYLKAVFFGVTASKDKEAQVTKWEQLSLISALLLTVSAAGLFSVPSYSLPSPLQSSQEQPIPFLYQATTITFCISSFCFLTSTVTGSFFMQYALSNECELDALQAALGFTFYFPGAYFRLGYFTMVLGIAFWFMMCMHLAQMLSCLAFCTFVFILPMFYATGKSMSSVAKVVALDEASRPFADHV